MSKPLWLKSRLGVRSSIPCPDSAPLSTTVKGVEPCRPTTLSGNGWALGVTDGSPRKVLSGVDVAEENVQVEDDGESEQDVVSETGLDIGVRTCSDVTGGCGDDCWPLFDEDARPDGVNLTGSSLVMA